MSRISVLILTHNEQHHIERAIKSVRSFASEVFVIDSGSTDETVSIAKLNGAVVLFNPWVNYATQFQWGLENAAITGDWVMRLDSDEIVEPDLAREIAKTLPTLGEEITGIKLQRKHIFMGRWIKHGGRYPLTLLRIWRRGTAHIENRWMDEHIILERGVSVTLSGGFNDVNLGDLGFFTDKHNKYATREAVDVLNQRYKLFSVDDAFEGQEDDQAKRKRAIKEGFYNKLPFGAGPLLYFLYRYFIQLGILDGVEGAIYHVLQGFWYRFLVDAKTVELDRAIRTLDKAQKITRLADLTGLKL